MIDRFPPTASIRAHLPCPEGRHWGQGQGLNRPCLSGWIMQVISACVNKQRCLPLSDDWLSVSMWPVWSMVVPRSRGKVPLAHSHSFINYVTQLYIVSGIPPPHLPPNKTSNSFDDPLPITLKSCIHDRTNKIVFIKKKTISKCCTRI